MTRRNVVAVAVTALAFSVPVLAQKPPALPGNYPAKPVKILGGGSVGGGTDIIARLLAQKFTENWGRSMIVENHPSSLGSLIALEMTAKAAPDGYTLHLTTSSGMVNAILVTKVPYNVRASIAPIAQLTLQPYVLAVHQAVPAATLKEFITYAKSKKGTLNYGSTGSGSTTHLGMELLKSLAGMEMQHIPYKGGGQVLTDIVAGRIEVMFSSPITASAQVKAGKLRLLGIGSAKRSKLLPDIPTIAESGLPGFELTGWYGLIAPVGAPAAIVTALNREAVQIMNTPEMQAKLAASGSEAPDPHTPAEFAKIISSEIDIWEKVIRTSNIKLDN